MQKLLIPIKNCMITAGYQNTAYRKRFGFSHYGQDMISTKQDRQIVASGEGKVLLTGVDSTLGQVMIIMYPRTYNHETESVADIVIRYCHMDSISVKVGKDVALGTHLGFYGNTGRYSSGPHLHVEVDYDTKFFAYSATVSASGSLIKAGNALSMFCPAQVLYTKLDAPEQQTCARSKARFDGIPYVWENELPLAL